jgi:hypothetical protein
MGYPFFVLNIDDDESRLQNRGDEQADHGAEDGSLAAEDRRAADDDRGDDVEVGERLPGDGRGAELRERQHGAQSRHGAGQRVDEDQMTVDVDADPAGAELVGADRVRIPAELRLVQHDRADDHDDEGDERQRRDADDLDVRVEVGEHLRNGSDVDAAGEHLRQAEGDGERAQRDDQRRDLRFGDQEPVERAPGDAGDQRAEDADASGGPAVAADALHHLRGDHRGEHEHGADGQVDAGSDDHEGHADAEDGPDGDVLRDQREVAGGQELVAGGDGERRDDDQQDPEDPHRLEVRQPLEV